MLERPHIAGPRLLPQPRQRRCAQGHAPAEPADQPGGKMPRQRCDVGAPLGKRPQVIRLLPPLVIAVKELERGVAILEEILA